MRPLVFLNKVAICPAPSDNYPIVYGSVGVEPLAKIYTYR